MVGFEPTPFRNRALIYRLRPLGHIYLTEHYDLTAYSFLISTSNYFRPTTSKIIREFNAFLCWTINY
jgi:hypothetical protein